MGVRALPPPGVTIRTPARDRPDGELPRSACSGCADCTDICSHDQSEGGVMPLPPSSRRLPACTSAASPTPLSPHSLRSIGLSEGLFLSRPTNPHELAAHACARNLTAGLLQRDRRPWRRWPPYPHYGGPERVNAADALLLGSAGSVLAGAAPPLYQRRVGAEAAARLGGG